MAIIEDGEKWACDACVKGHRVSSCQHKDRPLQHINRKGRPVSQCQHCRGLRKQRSAHVKCVCAEHGIKRDRSRDRSVGSVSVGSVDSGRCNCMYGMPCSCALKREALDSEDLSRLATHNNLNHHRRAYSYNKPIMANRRSDSHVHSVRGGHHPPLHRLNHAHHEVGLPYTVRQFSRSTGNFEFPQRSFDTVPPTSSPVYPHQGPDVSALVTPRQNNFVRSEVNSPAPPSTVSPNADNWNRPMEPHVMTGVASPNPTRHSVHDISRLSTWEYLSSPYLSPEQAPTSAGADQFHLPMHQHYGSLDQFNAYPNGNANFSEPDLQRSSFISIEQPGLSHSPSASASDTGESAVNFGDHSYHDGVPQQQSQKESGRLWTLPDYGESPSSDFNPQAYSTTSTPFVYSTSEHGLSGFTDYMGGPGPATSDEFKQDSVSPINFSIDPPPSGYNTTGSPSTASEYTPSTQPDQTSMNQPGLSMVGGQNFGTPVEFQTTSASVPIPPVTSPPAPYAVS